MGDQGSPVPVASASGDGPETVENLSENIESIQIQSIVMLPSLVKVYVGSLPADLDEVGLRALISERNLPEAETVLVKRGYAFLEFGEQDKADQIIASLDGSEFQGQTLRAEMSVASTSGEAGGHKKLNTHYKVVVSNIPEEVSREDLEPLLKDNPAAEISISGEIVTLTYNTKEEAEKAVSELQETEFRGQSLQARLTERKSPRRTTGASGSANSAANNQRHIEFPLRILVQSDMVGAIIGRGGQTIRQITQQTRARVDVHRKDSVGSVEKAITIYGQPENCSNACLQILKVMQEEARNTEKSDDIPLKILAHNNLIGRIIGKQGNTIKRIMEDTDTKITVSSINDINSFNMERIITIKGEPENVCKAEAEVSAKLRQAYESDLNAMTPQNVMYPGLHPAAVSMVPPLGMGLAFNPPSGLHNQQPHVRLGGNAAAASAFMGGYYANAPYNGVHLQAPGGVSKTGNGRPSLPPAPGVMPGTGQNSSGGGMQPYALPGVAPDSNPHHQQISSGPLETTHMYIPNSAVGAVIGAKGSYIRDLNKYSGYSIKIASSGEDTSSYPAAVNSADRQVTIVGPTDRFWVPQYLIYEKLKIEGFTEPHDGEVTLTVEMFVPSSQVGRIIGKGGTNVRELQRLTGAIIKLPEQLSPPPKDETSVVIIGKWIQALTAQQRLRAMLAQSSTTTAKTTPMPVNGTSTLPPATASVATASATTPVKASVESNAE